MQADLSNNQLIVQYIKVLFAGVVFALSFAPFGISVLSWLTLYLLFDIINRLSSKQALKAGWIFGLGCFGFGVHWIYNSVSMFGGAILPLAVGVTLLLVCIMAAFPAFAAWAYVKLRGDYRGKLNAPLFAALWVIAELLRGKVMGGFPWLLVGYSQTSTLMGSLAPIIGVYGISFLWVWFASAFVPSGYRDITNDKLQDTAALVKRAAVRLCAVLACVAILVATLMAVSQIQFTQPKEDKLAIRMVQASIPQELKFSRERLQTSLNQYTRLSFDNLKPETQLIIWPETAIPTFYNQVEEAMQPFVSQLQANDVELLTGVFSNDNGKVHNSVRQLGSGDAVYHKRHLVPFGEYMPFRFLLNPLHRFINIPMSDLSPGDGPHTPLAVAGEHIGISICFEDGFGEEMRAVLPTATVLVNVSNDAWFGEFIAPHQHEQVAQMRARELGRPLVRVTNTGVSSSIDHNGNVLGRIPQNEEGVLDVTVTPRTGITPYARTGNFPVGILAFLIVGLFWSQRRRKAV